MVNSTILQGRLVRDPELSTTPSGVEICRFTVAWSEKYKENERQLFLDCDAWRQMGVFINKYFKKGQEIIVEGKLETNTYTDSNGNNRSRIKLTVDKANFCGKRDNNFDGQATTQTQPQQSMPINTNDYVDADEEVNDDDLPF